MLEMAGMWEQIDRIFEYLFGRSSTSYESYVVVNIYMMQTAKNVIVEASIPRIKPDEVNISVESNTLNIRSEIKTDKEVKDVNSQMEEIKCGLFARSVLLPTQVIFDKAKFDFENGIFKLALLKAEEAKLRTISIKVK